MLRRKMIKIYKNVMSDQERLKSVFMMGVMPEECWTQSVCTDSPVDQLREYMPAGILATIQDVHINMQKTIERDFSVSLKKPVFKSGGIVTVDRRLQGYSLPPHRDIPTGDFVGHIGSASGESNIEISCVFYWNNDFTGGELYFEHEDFLYQPVAGDLVVFNSNLEHEILEIKSGIRYSTQYFFDRA
jgi:predicted 2-oxoglutarate/Fe(II)-dependent dioxygenase YbiX